VKHAAVMKIAHVLDTAGAYFSEILSNFINYHIWLRQIWTWTAVATMGALYGVNQVRPTNNSALGIMPAYGPHNSNRFI